MIRRFIDKRGRSIYVSWYFSYIIIATVCIMVSVIAYSESLRVVENEVNLSNMAMLKQVQLTIDGYMRDITGLSNTIALNPMVNSFMNRKRPFVESEWYEISEINKVFRTYMAGNSFINSFYVYYKESNLGIAQDGSYEGEFLYEIFHQSESFSYDNWLDIMSTAQDNRLMSGAKFSSAKNGRESIALIQTLPINNPVDPKAAIVIMVDEVRLKEIIWGIRSGGEEAVMILNRENQIVGGTNIHGQTSFALDLGDKAGQEGTFYSYNGKERNVISYVKSQVNEWKYVSVIPYVSFSQKLTNIRNLFMFCIAACAVIGAFLSFVFSRKNYNPVNELVQSIAGKSGLRYNLSGSNEYQYIRDTLNLTFDEKDKISRKLKQQSEQLKLSFLERLIKGTIGDKVYIYDMLASYNISLISEYFIVILFNLEDYSSFLENEDNQDKEIILMNFIVSNVVEELVGKNHVGYMTEVDGMMACIVNINEGRLQEAKADLTQIASEAHDILIRMYRIYTNVAVSGCHETLAGIHTAYEEAMEVLEYKIVMGSSNIIAYDDIVQTAGSGEYHYAYSLETEQKLINLVKTGDFENASDLLKQVFDNNLSEGNLPIYIVKCLMFDMVSTWIKIMDELFESMDRVIFEEFKPIEKLVKCETVSEMKKLMLEILHNFCDVVDTRKKSHNVDLKDRVEQYIHENYTDVNLGVLTIAQNFDKNPLYISRFFKEQSGESMLDYIHKVRLEKAKELLRDKNHNIGDIAIEVGYFNNNAFTRSFKKFEGVTPKKYREISNEI